MTAASEPRCPIKRWKQRKLPTGLGFALADSVSFLDAAAWDRAKAGASVFLGSTALEPKARLGAKPAPLSVYLRHRLPVFGALVRKLLGSVPVEEAPERNPFKES